MKMKIPYLTAIAVLFLSAWSPQLSRAATVIKAETGADLNDGASWTGAVTPTSADVATWTSASLGTGLTLGANTNWLGINVTGALSDIGITGAGTLTLGGGGIDMSASTVGLALGHGLALSTNQNWLVNAGKSLTLSGGVGGAYALSVDSLTYWSFLPASAATVFSNVTIASIISGGGRMGGSSVNSGTPVVATPFYFNHTGTNASYQLQVVDGSFTKCVKILLAPSGANLTAYVVYAKYNSGSTLGYNFDGGGTANTIATSSGAAGYGAALTFVGVGNSATYSSYVPASPTTATLFANTPLANVTGAAGTMAGGWLTGIWSATAYFFSNDGTNASYQLQLYDGTFTKCAKVQLTTSGADILGTQVYAKYKSGNYMGQNFDSLTSDGAPPVGSGGYGVLTTTLILGRATGTVTLSGANTYSGDTVIGAGKLDLTGSGTLGNGTYAGALLNNGLLHCGSSAAQTLSGVISGPGVLLKAGAGTLTLSGPSTYSGPTTVSRGTMLCGSGGALGASVATLGDTNTGMGDVALLASAAVTLNNALVVANQGSGAATLGTANFTAAANTQFGGLLTLNRAVTLQAGSSDRTTFANRITGSGDVTIASPFASSRRIVLQRSSGIANDFVGNLFLGTNAWLQVGVADSIGNRTIPDNAAVHFAPGAALRLAPAGSGDGETVGTLKSQTPGAGTVDMFTGTSFTLSMGADNGSGTFSGLITNSAGSLSVTKVGTGMQTLGGTNTYTGPTMVSAGTLNLVGRLTGGGALTLADGATLSVLAVGGSATINNAASLILGNSGATTLNFSNYSGHAIAPITCGNLTNNSTVTINISGPVVIGQFPLIRYSGTKAGAGSLVLGALPRGVAAALVDNTADKSVDLNVTSQNPLIWSGALGDLWDIAGTANWTLAGSPSTYLDGDILVFDDTATATAITLNTTVIPTSMNFSNATKAYTVSGSGAIAGSVGLTKNGSAALTVSTANTYTGPTIVGGGTLEVTALANGGLASPIGSAGALLLSNGTTFRYAGPTAGTDRAITLGGVGSVEIANSAAALTESGVIGGSGELVKAGPGTLVLVNTNTYPGNTAINGGTLQIGNGARAGALASADITIAGGATLNLQASSGQIFAHNLSGAGTLRVSGNQDPQFTGNNTGLTGPVVVDGAGAQFRTRSDNAWSGLSAVTVTNGGMISIFSWVDFHDIKAGSLWGNGTVRLGGPGANKGLIVGGNDQDAVFSGTIVNDAGGAGFLTKIGAGAQTLSGVNTYSGATTISNGTLLLNGSLAGSGVTVVGGTLGGSGTINSPVTVQAGGLLQPGLGGTPIATLTINSSLSLAGATVIVLNRTNAQTSSRLAGLSTVTFGGTLTVTNTGPALQLGDTFTLFSATARSGAFATATLPPLEAGLAWATTNNYGTLQVVSADLPPTFTRDPQSRSVLAGGTVLFSVAAYAGGPLEYQWLYNEAPLVSATNATLWLTNVPAGAAGNYRAVAIYGTTNSTSAVAVLTVLTPAGNTYAGAVLADTPVAYWRLGEASGATAYDSLGTNDGAYFNNYTLGVADTATGDGDTAVRFDGATGSKAEVAYTPTLNPSRFTVECWARAAGGAGTYRSPVSSRNDVGPGTTYGYILYASAANKWEFWSGVGASGWAPVAGPPVTVGQWVHVVAVYDGTNKYLFVNGALYGALTASFAPNTARPLRFGAGQNESNPGSFFFPGDVDDVAIYSRALSMDRVLAHYLAATGTNPPPLAPFLIGQPQSLNRPLGTQAAFSVISGGSLPFSYQWRLNGTALANETNAALGLPSVQMDNAGSYDVVITNSGGSITSAVAVLTISAQITGQPQPATAIEGATASFSVTAIGTALQYQWQKDNVDLAGATNSTLTIAPVVASDEAGYRVRVSNTAGSNYSEVAYLTVIPTNPPVILQHPQSRVILVGGSARFTVVAAAYPRLTYQWLVNDTPLLEATNSTLQWTGVSAGQHGNGYRAVVGNEAGYSTSAVAVLTVPSGNVLPAVIGADSPAAYWRLGESGGPMALDMTGAHDGAYSNNVTLGVAGALVNDPDTAAHFDGVGAKLDVPFSAALNATTFTVECWVRVTAATGTHRSPFTSRADGNTRGYIFYATPADTWEFWSGTGGSPGSWHVSAGPAVQYNQWVHLAGTYNGATKQFYVNGFLVASASVAFVPNPSFPLRMGAGATDSPTGNYFFPGEVDEVAVFPTALSADRIAAHFAAARGKYNNHAPAAHDDDAGVGQGRTLTMAAVKLLANDSDADGDALSIMSISATSTNGVAIGYANGLITYIPPATFLGEDRVSYSITDGYATRSYATLVIKVTSTNAPSANVVWGPVLDNGIFRVRFLGVPGYTYTVEYTDSLSPVAWRKRTNLVAPDTDQGAGIGVIEFSESAGEATTRYYRTVHPAY